jgi:hypothetical protein
MAEQMESVSGLRWPITTTLWAAFGILFPLWVLIYLLFLISFTIVHSPLLQSTVHLRFILSQLPARVKWNKHAAARLFRLPQSLTDPAKNSKLYLKKATNGGIYEKTVFPHPLLLCAAGLPVRPARLRTGTQGRTARLKRG